MSLLPTTGSAGCSSSTAQPRPALASPTTTTIRTRMMARQHRRGSTSHSYTSSSSSSGSLSAYDDEYDEDAITPCPPHPAEMPEQQEPEAPNRQHASAESAQGEQRRHRSFLQKRGSWRSGHGERGASNGATVRREEGRGAGVAGGNLEAVDAETLWRRMLAVQRLFGCYNSARMRAALDDDGADVSVPSRTCLDLLNDSIDALPEAEKAQLEAYLCGQQGTTTVPAMRGERRGWRSRLLLV